VLTNQTNRHTN